VQRVEGGEPVDRPVAGWAVGVGQPGERLASLGDVEYLLAAGRRQVGERGEELARLHRGSL
jgi:hypothetical protein